MNGHDTPELPTLLDPIHVLFERCKARGGNTKIGIYAFPPDGSNEQLLFVAHGPEAQAFMALLIQAAEPLFDAAEVPGADAD